MKGISCIVTDVDGTLTDGRVSYSSDGTESKAFHVADGLGIVLALRLGYKVGTISGRSSASVRRRMTELGVTEINEGISDKAACIKMLAARWQVSPENIAYIGDDINDIPAFRSVGFKIATANACRELKELADFVTLQGGGYGAVREAIELILRAQGRLGEALAAYLASGQGVHECRIGQ